MNDKIKEKFYGMKDVPDILIYFPKTTKHITICNLKSYNHRLNGFNSEIRFVDSLMNEDTIKYLSEMVNGECSIYICSPTRSLLDGKDKYIFYLVQNASLLDFKFGVAADGEPSQYSYTFSGDLIERIQKTGVDICILDLLEKDTGYNYN